MQHGADANCPHLNFVVHANVGRIQKSESEPENIVAYMADIKVCCHECGQPFEFLGLPHGLSFYRPTVSIDGQELRVPLVIPGSRPPEGLAGFSVTRQEFDAKPERPQ